MERETMKRLPNELIDRILGYSVSHFSELIYQGAVCRLWKKIAEGSLLWFSLELKYSIPSDCIDSINIFLQHSGAVELYWNPNSPQPPSSLPLGIYDLIFQVNTTSIISRNHKTASKFRKWFISYVIYHKKYWKWYCYWKHFFCPPPRTQQFLEHLKTGLRLNIGLPTILFLVTGNVTAAQIRQLRDFLSPYLSGVEICGIIGYLSLTIFLIGSSYFENMRTLNRPKESFSRALFVRESPMVTFIMEMAFMLLTWVTVFYCY
jgi:hypothetical protein